MKQQKGFSIQYIMISGLAALTTACSTNGSAGGGGGGATASSSLQGNYSNLCSASSGSSASKTSVLIGASSITVEAKTYLNADCSGTPAATTSSNGTYAVGSEVASPAGAKEINIISGRMMMTVHNDMMINMYNSQNYCGVTWVRDVAQDLTGKTCGTGNKMPDAGVLTYSIYSLQGSSFLVGEESPGFDGKTAATRHSVLAESGFVKQ